MAAPPPEADAPLVVYSNAVLSFPACFEGLQPVPRRHSHLPQFGRRVQGKQLTPCAPLNRRWQTAGQLSSKQPFGLCARKAQNHQTILTPGVNSVKQRAFDPSNSDYGQVKSPLGAFTRRPDLVIMRIAEHVFSSLATRFE